ncbi:LPS export ABC transporter periplasmic protein LptC [uncultured Roseovarius sp.]|uniref:LPS export ABC transporter periplasmic protein LptC n=1 Tax=uncultured Roseovarius sp. TaxID=293344 RepID=UPI002603DC78|nr:LPS export ABC transporter periplasmic protein LptC [uncultured Roseovarius sp.]
MAFRDNLYSRVIAWVKIILPLAALGILSTLFLISRTIDPAKSIPVAQIDLQQRAQELGATNPYFAGVTDTGDQIAFQSIKARPSPDDNALLLATDVTSQINLTSGTVIDIISDNADMHQRDLTATLEGNVYITSSIGYVMITDTLWTRLDEIYAETPGQVDGTGPLGDLTAGKMLLTTDPETGQADLLFTRGVKLLYTPDRTKE